MGSTREFATADVAQDCEEPRLNLRTAKRVEIAQRAQIAFLRCIVGIRRVAEQVSCQRVNVVEMGQCGIAKTLPWKAGGGMMAGNGGDAHQDKARRSIEHYCAQLLAVAASTTMAPVMCGCIEQKYS